MPPCLSHCLTLVDLLAYRGLHQSNQLAYIFIINGETEEISLTYQELDLKARAIAIMLKGMKAVGERALLLYPPGLEFITAFFGCLYAGVIAVPVYPPRRNQGITRLEGIVIDTQAKFVLSTTSVLASFEQSFSEELGLTSLRAIATDNIIFNEADHWQTPKLCESSLAFLQYTSGSTGTPKGVMVSHRHILHNCECIKQAFELTQDSVSVTWLPSFHDMGLIDGIIQPLYTGFPGILMPSGSFLQSPIRWLQAISRYHATHSGAPNFAYELCVNKITSAQIETLDLSTWSSAYSGAEPVRQETLERFAHTFAPCGFRPSFLYPCYGMAEATLMISGGNVKDEPVYFSAQATALEQNRVVKASEGIENVRHLVGCGHSWLETKIVIAHPDSLTRCTPDQVGEIWVSGASVAGGYWNRLSKTQQTFNAFFSDTGEGPFLRTGDLGFVQDGELFVTGRLKDLIIILGRNYYPQDIELTVEQSHPALRPSCGAAFSIEIVGSEKLVIVHEVERSYLRKFQANEVMAAIRQAVVQQYDLQVYAVVLLKTASLPKTSSGKIQRSVCRARFMAGSLDAVADWRVNSQNKNGFQYLEAEGKSLLQQMQTDQQQVIFSGSNNSPQLSTREQKSARVEAIEAWLSLKVSEQLEVFPENIDIRQPLANYGLSSLVAMRISGELQEWLGRQLSPTVLYEHANIEVLAQQLAQENGAWLKRRAIHASDWIEGEI